MGKWKNICLSDIADVFPSNVDKVISSTELPVLLCNYMDVYYKKFIHKELPFSIGSVRPSEFKKFQLHFGDVIVTKDSETPNDIGMPAVVVDNMDNLVCGYHLAIIRTDQSQNDGVFLMYALQGEKPVRYFSNMCNGLTRYGLTTTVLERQKISMPIDVAEQRKIAEILTTVDEAIDNTRTLIEKYSNVKTGMMQDLLEKGENVLLGDKRYFDINPRISMLPQYFYYIDLESVVTGELIKQDIFKKEDAPSRAQRLLRPNDILFQMVRPYQQNNYFFDQEFDLPAVASTGYAQIRTSQNPKFIYYALHTDKVLFNVVARCTGSNYPAINSTELKKINVVLPSIEEQDQIIEQLTAVDEKIQTERNYLAKLQNIKRGLMQDLLTNTISVDPLL